MRTVTRNNIFETNSSSVHSLTMCSSEEYQRWKNGELFFHKYENKFYTKEELINILPKDISTDLNDEETQEHLNDEGIYTFESYNDSLENYEDFRREYTTKSGEKVVAFGYYGNDY